MNPTHGIADGEVFEYPEKGPYTAAGLGDFGLLRYDESSDKLQCHICGEWYISLGLHVRRTHAGAVGDYKRRFGLKASTALVGLRHSAQKRQVALRLKELGHLKTFLPGHTHGRKPPVATKPLSGKQWRLP